MSGACVECMMRVTSVKSDKSIVSNSISYPFYQIAPQIHTKTQANGIKKCVMSNAYEVCKACEAHEVCEVCNVFLTASLLIFLILRYPANNNNE